VTVAADDSAKALAFSQRRFMYLASESEPSETWQVPINFRLRVNGGVQRMRLLLSSADQRVELAGRLEWVVVNEGGHGFYRVRYAPELLQKLTDVAFEVLAPVERFNLINDAWALTLAGLAPVGEYLDLTARFREEDDRNVWTALLASFAYLNRIIEPNVRSRIETLVRDRIGAAVARLGFAPQTGEDALVRQLRGELLRVMGTLGNDPTIQAKARDLYATCRQRPSPVDPDVQAALIAILAYGGGEGEYADFLKRFKTAETPQEEQRFLSSLAGFRDPGLLRRTLQLAVSDEVRTQDAPFLMRSLLMNVHGRDLAWQFVKDNWETMERRYPLGGLRRMCEGITALATRALEEDVRQFFTSRNISLGGKTLEQYLEQLRVAVAFREREAGNMSAYFSRLGETR